MVYGYETNKEFVDKSYQLLEKLKDKGLWDKDTLVIGLDKSVRPLTYALRKLSSVEGQETPDIRFFNYSSHNKLEDNKKIPEGFFEKYDIDGIKKYKNILILDDHIFTGNTLRNVKKLLKIVGVEDSKINLASLQNVSGKRKEFLDIIYSDTRSPNNSKWAIFTETGLDDKRVRKKLFSPKLISNYKSSRLKDKKYYSKFIENRRQLSKDIKNYLHEKHPEKISEKNKGLEKIISGIFIFSVIVGLFLSLYETGLTGNVIGLSGNIHNLFGIILVLVGIGGFFIYRKFRWK